jgi:hypothetical protein
VFLFQGFVFRIWFDINLVSDVMKFRGCTSRILYTVFSMLVCGNVGGSVGPAYINLLFVNLVLSR